ncbi:MAG: DUF3784 domain-containing protein [Sporomusaceae bacterium]|jgi:hypothetical protein|nr:DUF3784 domain-containing protein [Sporomusaceae bacterium]
MDIDVFIIFGIVLVPLIIMAIFLLNGKGAFLIAGYNTMSKDEQARYDEQALCHSVGWFIIGISFCMLLVPLGIYFDQLWLIYCGIAFASLLTFGYVFYVNTGNRFRKNQDSTIPVVQRNKIGVAKTSKRTIITAIAAVVVPIAILIATGILFYQGQKEPVVSILDNKMEIKAMYGVSINFTEIRDISLVEKNMREIGIGRRTNGYGGVGETLKGHFRSNTLGETLLFVRSKSSPTIRIERAGKPVIYLSFRDGKKTKLLYEEMTAAFTDSNKSAPPA